MLVAYTIVLLMAPIGQLTKVNTRESESRSKRLMTQRKGAEDTYTVDKRYSVNSYPYKDFSHITAFGIEDKAPYMNNFALKILREQLQEGNTVLDIGCGNGYLTVNMAIMLETGRIIGVEPTQEKADLAKKCLLNISHYELDNIEFVAGSVEEVATKYGPFDAIHVAPVTPKVPEVLLQQLKPGGRLFIPIGTLELLEGVRFYDKHLNGTITWTEESQGSSVTSTISFTLPPVESLLPQFIIKQSV